MPAEPMGVAPAEDSACPSSEPSVPQPGTAMSSPTNNSKCAHLVAGRQENTRPRDEFASVMYQHVPTAHTLIAPSSRFDQEDGLSTVEPPPPHQCTYVPPLERDHCPTAVATGGRVAGDPLAQPCDIRSSGYLGEQWLRESCVTPEKKWEFGLAVQTLREAGTDRSVSSCGETMTWAAITEITLRRQPTCRRQSAYPSLRCRGPAPAPLHNWWTGRTRTGLRRWRAAALGGATCEAFKGVNVAESALQVV
jgi:hypothetical protein